MVSLSAITHVGIIVIITVVTALTKVYTDTEGVTKEDKYHKITGERFIARKDQAPDVYKFHSGLRFKILDKGQGLLVPGVDTPVEIHYEASFVNGTVFDSSYARDTTLEVTPAQGNAGWLQALQIMREGDKWELYVPDKLAYGPRGLFNKKGEVVPPYATVIYILEVIKIVDSKRAKSVEEADRRIFVPTFGRPYELL